MSRKKSQQDKLNKLNKLEAEAKKNGITDVSIFDKEEKVLQKKINAENRAISTNNRQSKSLHIF